MANAVALHDMFRNIFQDVGKIRNHYIFIFLICSGRDIFSTEHRFFSKFSVFYRLSFWYEQQKDDERLRNIGEMLLTGKTKALWEKPVLATLFAASPALTDQEMKPGLCGETSAQSTASPLKAQILCHKYLKIQLTSL